MHSHNVVKKKTQIENKCIIGILMSCHCANGQMKSHQRAIWVLHKILQDLFCRKYACSDMSSRHLVCCFYILQHMCLLLFLCSYWHWDNVIRSLACLDRLSIKSEKSHCLNDHAMNILLTQILSFIKLIMKMSDDQILIKSHTSLDHIRFIFYIVFNTK